MAGRVSVRSRGRLLAGSALGLATAAALTASPAAAACLGENTATVTCNAANPATGGTLGTGFAGTTVVNIDNGAQIDTGGAIAIVSGPGDLTFNHNDLVFGITNLGPQGIGLGNDFGSITYVGNGAVSAAGVAGVNAVINAGAGAIAITQNGTVTVTGNGVGIRAEHAGLGPAAGTNGIVIRGSGSVSGGGTSPAIFAQITNAANASNILVDRTGAMSGATGVNAQTSGTGSIEVLVNGAVTATNGWGVLAFQNNTAAGTNAGVHVGGSGSITQSGAIAPAIHAQTQFATNAGSVLVDYTGSITSSTGGILAAANGGGNATVIGTGNVTSGADPIFNTGIEASSSGGNGNVLVAAVGTISGGYFGIRATAVNLGTVTVTAINDVTGFDGPAISTETANGLNTVNVTGGVIRATANGVSASSSGTGGVAINMTGGQIGTAGARVGAVGIGVLAGTGTANVVANGAIFATTDGIRVQSNAATSSNFAVTATGAIDANATGISAAMGNAAASGQITIVQSGSVRGSDNGIAVNHSGSGNVAVTVTGTVTGTTINGVGVVANGTTTVVNTGTISGVAGIGTGGTGSATITNAGTIIGTGGEALQLGGTNNQFVMQGPTAVLTGAARGSGTDTFRFAGAGSNTFDVSQVTTGWTALQKTDASTWTLTGTATTAAPMTVSGGTLAVNGNTATFATTVNTGGTLGGTGTVGTTTVNGGTLAPGNSIGTLTVQGNLVLGTAATYLVEVSPTTADRTTVTGTAALAGTLRVMATPGSYVKNSYTILSAGVRTGTFDAVSAGSLLGELSYTPTDVLLTLSAALSGQGLTGNPQNVAQAIDRFFNAGGALPAGFTPLFGLTGAQLGSALSQLTGEVAAGGQQAAFQSTQSFLNLMLDPFVAGRGGNPAAPLGFAAEPASAMQDEVALAYAKAGMPVKAPPMVYEPRWSVWGAAYGGAARVDGDAAVGSTTTDSRAGGFAAGADYRLWPDTVVGFALAGGGTTWSLGGLGSGRSDTFQAGLYGSHRFGAAYLSAALAYAWHDTVTSRSVAIGPETLEGRFRPDVFAGRAEAGYRFGWASYGLTPYAAVQVQSFHAPAYTEVATAGAGAFALSYASRTETATRTELGVWADHRQRVTADTELVLRGRAAWAHDFDTDRRIGPTFLTLPGASFTVDGASPSPDLALLSAVAELRMRNGISLSAKFDGEFGSRSESYAATGTFRYSW